MAASAFSACASAYPVGTVDGRVPSRFDGTALSVVSGRAGTKSARLDQRYSVQPGDTLWSLARRFNTSVEKLMQKNGLGAPEQLKAGSTLRVPETAEQHMRDPAPPARAQQDEERQSEEKASSGYRFRWPVAGKITERYGYRGGRNHDGVDIAAELGAPVHAAAAGTVLFSAEKAGYGNLVILRHDDGYMTVYAHQQRNLVRKGQRVRSGQLIGRIGQTGRAAGPHLHFEVRKGVRPENPLLHLPP